MARRRKRGKKNNGQLNSIDDVIEAADEVGAIAGNEQRLDINHDASDTLSDEPPLHCQDREMMPGKLKKYWDKRYSLFSKYDRGILMDRGRSTRTGLL